MIHETVERFSMPIEDMGKLFAQHFETIPSTKRARKALFNSLSKMLHLGVYFPPKSNIISIGRGVDNLGNVTVEVLYHTEKQNGNR